MGSLRLVMHTANQTVLLQKKQQCCSGLVLQRQRIFCNSNGGLTASCMIIEAKRTIHERPSGYIVQYQQNHLYSNFTLKDGRRLLNNRNSVNKNPLLEALNQKSTQHGFCNNETKSAKKSETTASSAASPEACLFDETANLGLFAKFKLMYKKYWYVLLPVHVVTSIGWFGGFYYMSKSGVDVPSLLQFLNISEAIIEKVQHSNMGHYAIAYLCYKIATPLRYAVTLGGTTVSIKVLAQAGHIKPMPTKTEFMAMIEKKKGSLQAKFDNKSK